VHFIVRSRWVITGRNALENIALRNVQGRIGNLSFVYMYIIVNYCAAALFLKIAYISIFFS
jgi:hypothetical protein